MSIKIMSLVWENFPRGGSEKLVLLALADWAGDDGARIWPAVATIAHKTNMSERQVQRVLARFVDEGILTITANEHGGRNMTRHYRMNIGALKGDNMSPIADERVTFETEKGDILSIKGDTHVTRTVIEPSREPLMAVQPEKIDPPCAEKKYFFEGRMGRVLQKDTIPWAKSYHTLTPDDARSILQLCDDYYFGLGKPPKSMFFAYSRWLQKEHDQRAKAQQEAERDRTIIYG